MGIIAFLALKIGGVVMQSSTSATSQQQESIWILAFLAGFSDRFSDSVLRTLSGKVGASDTAIWSLWMSPFFQAQQSFTVRSATHSAGQRAREAVLPKRQSPWRKRPASSAGEGRERWLGMENLHLHELSP
jgi:hypothetical protein